MTCLVDVFNAFTQQVQYHLGGLGPGDFSPWHRCFPTKIGWGLPEKNTNFRIPKINMDIKNDALENVSPASSMVILGIYVKLHGCTNHQIFGFHKESFVCVRRAIFNEMFLIQISWPLITQISTTDGKGHHPPQSSCLLFLHLQGPRGLYDISSSQEKFPPWFMVNTTTKHWDCLTTTQAEESVQLEMLQKTLKRWGIFFEIYRSWSCSTDDDRT